MEEPEKPFACTVPDCMMTFTNEDHLHVHVKKHEMMLQLGEQKAVFVADQTPTPTRFIRNCEEVGLFQDLQNVNPFDEGFKRAMETKQGLLSLENGLATSTDDLHTPQMFPQLDPSNIIISRSSSDESGAIKEFETTTISKCTNQVTTISRVIEKHDELPNEKNPIKNSAVSYTNNVIKIHSNVEIIKSDIDKTSDEKNKDFDTQAPPIMSQKSIDYVVDSLTTDLDKKNEYEVLIKLPSGQQIKLTAAEEVKDRKSPKDLLKKVLTEKVESKSQPIVLPNITSNGGILIPVSIINSAVPKITKLPVNFDKRPIKRKSLDNSCPNTRSDSEGKMTKEFLESRSAASRRYRARLKETMVKEKLENRQLKELNDKLTAENQHLKLLILKHMKKCNHCEDFNEFHSKTKLKREANCN